VSFWKKKSEGEEARSSAEGTPPLANPATVPGGVSVSGSKAGVSKAGSPKAVPPKAAVAGPVPPSGAAAPVVSPAVLPGGDLKAEDVLVERFGTARSALGEGTVIQGKLSFDTPVRIDGRLSGEIFSSKVLIIGPSGHIDATIEAAALVILGSVTGTINASERVELWAGASLEGVVKCPVIVIQEGSRFSGTSLMLASQAGYASEGPQGTSAKKNSGSSAAGVAEEVSVASQRSVQGGAVQSDPDQSGKIDSSKSSPDSSRSTSASSSSTVVSKKDAHVH